MHHAHATDDWPSLARIELLVLDFDGVMTDNRVIVHQDGTESVVCHRGDGLGIQMVQAAGVEVFVLSKQKNPVVAARCGTLGVAFQQSTDDKLPALRALLGERGLRAEQAAYIGNDVNDLEALAHVGVPIAVADAEPEVLSAVRLRTARNGGAGAIREVCDRILADRAADR